jgi:predicted branched-subunit amino acid permease
MVNAQPLLDRGTPRRARLITLALATLWLVGLALTVLGGTQPGFVPPSLIGPYPVTAVIITSAVITAESVLLSIILRPKTYQHTSRRAAVAIAIFGSLWVADCTFVSAWTDQAGYRYANADFLFGVVLFLLALVMLRVRERRNQPLPNGEITERDRGPAA